MGHLVSAVSKQRLLDILERLPNQRIGVIGDLGLDAYWYADMTRSFLSRETPLFPRPVIREIYSPGAGANVAQNLKDQGVGKVSVFSVLGTGWQGDLLRDVLIEQGVDVTALVVSPHRTTTTFIKPILTGYNSEQEDARIDFENAEPLLPGIEDRLLDALASHLPGLDALLVADQLDLNGIITPRVRETLNALAAKHTDKIFLVDSRQHIGLFRNMILKPNWVEATAAVYPELEAHAIDIDALKEIGGRLRLRTGRTVFVTLSEQGVLVSSEEACERIPAAPVRPPLDPVGAGDTFIATLASTLAAGATPRESGIIANLAAAVVLEKLNQTGTASSEEILERFELAQSGAERI